MSDGVGELPHEPLLNPAFVVVAPNPDTVQIRAGPWTGPVLTIRETDSDEQIRSLFEQLDGNHTLDSILEPYDGDDREAVLSLFRTLREKNVLYDATDWAGTCGRPQLQVPPQFGESDAGDLETKTALVVSVGEPGPQIAADLIRAGVGSVILHRPLDDQLVDENPLGLLDLLEEKDAFTVRDDDLETALGDADAAVLATDTERPSVASAFNEVAHETGTPWLLAQVRGFDGLIGPVVFPGETACYRCLEQRIASNIGDSESYGAYRTAIDGTPSLESVGLPSYSRAIAGFASVDLLHLLTYGQACTVGRTIAMNFLDLSVEVNEVLKRPRCDCCGSTPGDDVKRFVTIDDLLRSDIWTEHGPGSDDE